ncbi:stage II sporulation protein M [Lacinutrix sp. Hel_I_90]|uniref:stage II sporulation protein M n=1 Tax=Lacinutrix sp. Hel_I_90 TaxID=1249999 RepID=UPI0005CA2657|nr:stage II sporulation protein M [Lacinutrix sp. Hel_I_90]
MKNRLIALVFFVFGILLFFISKDTSIMTLELTSENSNTNISFFDKMAFFKGYEVFGIFIYNLGVAFLLSFVGYFTGGLLTLIILLWNGFLIAIVYNMAIYKLPVDTILYASKHAPIEIFAFLIFADFGLKGRFFIKRILNKNEIDFTLIPNFKNLIYPTILLILASILETI